MILCSLNDYIAEGQGFRACGRDQRAFRSPFGNLRGRPFVAMLLMQHSMITAGILPPRMERTPQHSKKRLSETIDYANRSDRR